MPLVRISNGEPDEADFSRYHQAHAPIAQQRSIEGHSVRAMYLLTAATDLKRITPQSVDHEFESAIYRLWDNMVNRKMYVTGGIGAIKQWEGFGLDYFLPQGTDEGGCYSETCAAIGVMMFAERLLKVHHVVGITQLHHQLTKPTTQINRDGRFADIMELCLYNAVLTSMSHDGKRFTYVNQLASSDKDLSSREKWFTCACCPPNVLRLLGQIGGYVWDYSPQPLDRSAEVVINLYISSTLRFYVGDELVEIEQKSDWPLNGKIQVSVTAKASKVLLKMRIPGWAPNFKVDAL